MSSRNLTKTLKINSKEILESDLEKLLFKKSSVKLVLCYVSPFLNFESISLKVKSFFGSNTTVIASTSAGELCTFNIEDKINNIYLEADEYWESVVLQSFSSDMLESAETISFSLYNGVPLKEQRDLISKDILNTKITTDIVHFDTVAFTLIDGLSHSEDVVLDSIYRSGKIKCQIIGGSSGGELNFQKTAMFNNESVVNDKAIIVLLKVKKGIWFGILKSQNFELQDRSFEVLDANVEERYVETVLDKELDEKVSIIDYLSKIFECDETELDAKLLDHTLGMIIGKEEFIRSISHIDLINRKVYFYSDIDYGDELHIFKKTDFIKQTKDDYQKFLADKPVKPFAGILNDCILRRVKNKNVLNDLNVFEDVPLSGFSTFGEILGVNINETLTGIFFFEVPKDKKFKDSYLTNFVENYANFKIFFESRELNMLRSKKLKNNYKILSKTKEKLTKFLDNTGQGFLSFYGDLSIDEEFSKESANIFKYNLVSQNIANLLFPDDKRKYNYFKEIVDSISITDEYNTTAIELYLSLFPKETMLDNKILKLEYKYLEKTHVMMIITDITIQKELEKKTQEDKETLQMIVAVSGDKVFFNDIKDIYTNFAFNTNKIIDYSKTPIKNINNIQRVVHTLKGSFSQMYMQNIVNALHYVESSLSKFSEVIHFKNIDISNYLNSINFSSFLDKDFEIITNILGNDFIKNDESDMIAVSKYLLYNIEDKIQQCHMERDEPEKYLNLLKDINKAIALNLYDTLVMYPSKLLDLADKLHKKIYKPFIYGDDDTVLIQRNALPFLKSLIHIFNNSIDHGIETPLIRESKNKDPKGTINCSYRIEDENIKIVISDDGKGIDIDKIKEKYVDTNFTNVMLSEFIFSEGVTTKDDVSKISGRGIGMSAVKNEIEKIGGTVEVDSIKDVGITFTFTIPQWKLTD